MKIKTIQKNYTQKDGSVWDNLVVACCSCNAKKGDKLLEQSGMKLLRQPRQPYNKVLFTLNKSNVKEWKEYSYQ